MRMRVLLGVGIAAVLVFWTYLGVSSFYRTFFSSRFTSTLAMLVEKRETATLVPPTPIPDLPTDTPSSALATQSVPTPRPVIRPTLTLPLADTPLPIATVQAFRTLLAGPHPTVTSILSISGLPTDTPVAQGVEPPAHGTGAPDTAATPTSPQAAEATSIVQPLGQATLPATDTATPPVGPATPVPAISTVLPTEAAFQAGEQISPVETATGVPEITSAENSTPQLGETAVPAGAVAAQPDQLAAPSESTLQVADEATTPAELAPQAGEPAVSPGDLAVQPAEMAASEVAGSEATGSVSSGSAASPTPSALVGSVWNERWIPGLTLAGVKARLKNGYGLSCSAPVEEGGLSVWRCAVPGGKGRFSAVITGIDASRIVSVAGTVTGIARRGDNTAAGYLAFIAGQPYEGSVPARARTWVQQHLAAGGQTSIGEVSLGLSTSGVARTLELFAPATARGKG
jgi:hypothetical protein